MSPPILLTPRMLYLSSCSGPSWPSLIAHQCPLSVALVSVAVNLASNSADPDFGRSALGPVEVSGCLSEAPAFLVVRAGGSPPPTRPAALAMRVKDVLITA